MTDPTDPTPTVSSPTPEKTGTPAEVSAALAAAHALISVMRCVLNELEERLQAIESTGEHTDGSH